MRALSAKERSVDMVESGKIFADQGNFVEALVCFEQAIKLDEGNAEAWKLKSWALGDIGKWEVALQSMEKSLELGLVDAENWTQKAFILNRLGKFEEALESLDNAIAADSSHF